MRLPARLKRSQHGIYYFRLVVPPRFRAVLGRTELKKSLGTRDPQLARQMAYSINAEFVTRMEEVWREMAEKKFNPFIDLSGINVAKWTIKLPGGTVSAKPGRDQQGLQKALDDNPDLKEALLAQKPSAPIDHKAIAESLKEQYLIASNPDLRPLRFKEAIPKYENHQRAIRPNLGTIEKYVSVAREFGEFVGNKFIHAVSTANVVDFKAAQAKSGLKATTIDNKVIALGAFFTWAIQELHYPKVDLPTKGQATLTKKQRSKIAKKYERFNFDELKLIFEPAHYLKKLKRQPDHFWLPILALFTGARLEELCQLHLADVSIRDGIPYLDINSLDDKGVKTEAGIRKVPVHPVLVKLGLLKYVDAVRSLKLPAKQIFPYLQPNKKGVLSSPASKVFNRYFQSIGIKGDGESREKSFHSFRSTANQELTDRGVSLELRCQLVGHDLNNENIKTYRDPFPLPVLANKGINLLCFENEMVGGQVESIPWMQLKYNHTHTADLVKRLMVTVAADTARRKNVIQKARARGVSYSRNK